MQIYEIYFKSIYNECVIYVLLTVFVVKALKYIAFWKGEVICLHFLLY